MKTVREILNKKGSVVYSVTPDTTVYDALLIMAEREIGALAVLEGDSLSGIISERDYARKVILRGKSSKELPVKEIMSPEVIFVRPGNTIEECMALMTAKRIRHLPVIEDKKLAGLVSIGDIVKATIDEKEFIIDQLTNYISRTPGI
ncbi:MAG: CBS domain-containing protein [Bacteroidota bacterium]|nr:CBS domain-containing protein [Bacteroidota bacterium]MDP4192106.1 CBS domain-containing protein [Bacteroidota bacterium]MDP4195232.1 CBS domain-containing protein [Bacteroidota bacterium]